MAWTYGWHDEYIESLAPDVFQSYWLGAEVLAAEDQIYNIQASVYSNFKKEDRERIYKGLNKKIKSILDSEEGSKLSTGDAAKMLALKMRG